MKSRIRNLSKQIDTEKRDRREDRRRRDVSDDADERDRRWDRRRCVDSTERKRSKERRHDDSRDYPHKTKTFEFNGKKAFKRTQG